MCDEGLFLGWDDEDVLVSQNRMTGLNPDGSLPPEAPSGVGGYRVDVRSRGETVWHSLCRVEGEDLKLGPVALGDFIGEREVEVHPRRVKERFFLPIFFARWRGMSLVVSTEENRRLDGVPKNTKDPLAPIEERAVPFRSGQRDEFRRTYGRQPLIKLSGCRPPLPGAAAPAPGDARPTISGIRSS